MFSELFLLVIFLVLLHFYHLCRQTMTGLQYCYNGLYYAELDCESATEISSERGMG